MVRIAESCYRGRLLCHLRRSGFYVVVVEKGTGIGAMELIVERNGFVQPEPGPNMMWNTKYGHMAASAARRAGATA